MTAAYGRPAVDGPPVLRRWRLVAQEPDNVAVPAAELGRVMLEVERWFSMRRDAGAWVAAMRALGLEAGEPCPLATRYHGPSDSPSNAWSTRANISDSARHLERVADRVSTFAGAWDARGAA